MRPTLAEGWSIAICVATSALLAAGCASARTESRIAGVDLRPVMNALREDARTIAVALGEQRLDDAKEPSGRLAVVAIGRPTDPLEDRFRAFAADLNDSAVLLGAALDRGEPGAARAEFARVLERCDACHAEYRSGAGLVAP